LPEELPKIAQILRRRSARSPTVVWSTVIVSLDIEMPPKKKLLFFAFFDL
jgi:hypothetical protein